MRGMSRLVLVASVLFTSSLASGQVTKETVDGVRNFSKLETTIACAGATAPSAIAEIKKMGYKAVINLREPGEAGADIDGEMAAAKAADITFINLPFNSAKPDSAVVEQFIDAVSAPANQPAFVHCASGNRAAALWMVKRLVVDHWDGDRAAAEATSLGMTSPALKAFALDYAANHRR